VAHPRLANTRGIVGPCLGTAQPVNGVGPGDGGRKAGRVLERRVTRGALLSSPSFSNWGIGVGCSGTCWGRTGNRDHLGKDTGEKGKRRMTEKGREERKKVGSPWGSRWRWI